MTGPGSGGVTPLEAAAREIARSVIPTLDWDTMPSEAKAFYRRDARAALTTAIEALEKTRSEPRQLTTGELLWCIQFGTTQAGNDWAVPVELVRRALLGETP